MFSVISTRSSTSFLEATTLTLEIIWDMILKCYLTSFLKFVDVSKGLSPLYGDAVNKRIGASGHIERGGCGVQH